MKIMKQKLGMYVMVLGLAVLSLTTVSYGQAVNGATSGSIKNPASTPPPPANQPMDIHINNPLKVSTITDAIKLLSSVVLRIALPLIIIFFIWSGLSFVLARGKPEAVTKAKNMFFYTLIGTLLILGAWTITNAIVGTVNAIVS